MQRWHCFPCDAGGDVFDLIARKERLNFAGAMSKARQLLNGVPRDWQPSLELEGGLPSSPEEWGHELQIFQRQAAMNTMLLEQVLQLPGAGGHLVDTWGVGLDDNGSVLFPHWSPNRELLGCKVRHADGTKASLSGSSYRYLYGSWRPPVGEKLVILEGETDTVWTSWQLLFHGINYSAYGLPRGAQSRIIDEMLVQVNAAGQRGVIFGLDNDEEGRKATRAWRGKLMDLGVPTLSFSHLLPEGSDARGAGISILDLLKEAK